MTDLRKRFPGIQQLRDIHVEGGRSVPTRKQIIPAESPTMACPLSRITAMDPPVWRQGTTCRSARNHGGRIPGDATTRA
jgi:hypothetical protein